MKKLIIVLVIVAIIIIANIIIFNLLNNNNKDIASTNTHVNTNVNTANNTDANQLNQEGTNNGDASTVYFTSDISSEGLMKIYNELQFKPQGNVAVKISTGEAGGNNYLSPDLIKDLVQSVNGTIVECNTAYGGSRSSTAMHRFDFVNAQFSYIQI